MFEVFGVRAGTELAYRALLRRPDLTAPVDPTLLETPSASADEVFADLVRVGLLAPGPQGWTVVPPELAVDAMGSRAEDELDLRRQAIRQAREGIAAAVADVVDSHREQTSTFAEVVRGGDAVRARLHQLTHDVTDHVWSINPGPAPPPRSIDTSRGMDRTLRARGVHQRAVVADVAPSDPAFVGYLREVVDDGDHVRTHPAPPARLLLFDDTTAVVPLIERSPGLGALVVHEPGLVAPLTALFEQGWGLAAPFETARVDDPPDVDGPRIRQVLTLLVAGLPDAAVARQLGVSTRTVGRLVAEAARRLQASSRIETCIRAVQAGWIPQAAPAGPRFPQSLDGAPPESAHRPSDDGRSELSSPRRSGQPQRPHVTDLM